jgi:hypothetical protein
MTLKDQLGGSLRQVSAHTVVWEMNNGNACPATIMEQRMWELLCSLTNTPAPG